MGPRLLMGACACLSVDRVGRDLPVGLHRSAILRIARCGRSPVFWTGLRLGDYFFFAFSRISVAISLISLESLCISLQPYHRA